jgi:hypothetical protein
MEPKPDKSPMRKRQMTLFDKLVYIPTCGAILLLIVTVSIISAIIFACVAFSMPGNRPLSTDHRP